MPLRDHFHPPLSDNSAWESVHAMWAAKIVDQLNGHVLSQRYQSRQQVHHGNRIEIDVATYYDERAAVSNGATEGGGGTAVATRPATQAYVAPAPPITGEPAFDDPDVFEILVQRNLGGLRLVAAVELVSPGNKDRPENRRVFAAKCASYLAAGVSVVVVDIVTERAANLHAELCDVLRLPNAFAWEPPGGLAAAAYRTVKRNDRVRLDVWPTALAVGAALPTVPLWLAADLAVPLELDRTYEAACRSLRVE